MRRPYPPILSLLGGGASPHGDALRRPYRGRFGTHIFGVPVVRVSRAGLAT